MPSTENKILNYRVIGNGHPVVFLHGFLESMSMWDYLKLPESFQCIFVDLPGHGSSDDAAEDETMLSMAQQVVRLICSLNIDKYDVIGHSMGGYVGLEMKNVDDRCEKLVLLNSNFWNDSPIKLEQRNRVAKVVQRNKSLFIYEAIPNLFFDPTLFDEEVKSLIKESKMMSPENIARVSLAMGKRLNRKNLIRSWADSVLILQGKEDSTVKKDQMDQELKGVDLNYVLLKDVGHMAHIEDPERTSVEIVNFIQKKTETN